MFMYSNVKEIQIYVGDRACLVLNNQWASSLGDGSMATMAGDLCLY